MAWHWMGGGKKVVWCWGGGGIFPPRVPLSHASITDPEITLSKLFLQSATGQLPREKFQANELVIYYRFLTGTWKDRDHRFPAEILWALILVIFDRSITREYSGRINLVMMLVTIVFQESPRQTKPKERAKTKSSRISPIFVNSGVFPWENKHDSH